MAAPIQMGGPPGVRGFTRYAGGTWKNLPSQPFSGSVQSRRSDLDELVQPPAAGLEWDVRGFELGIHPAGAGADDYAAFREDVERSQLAGHQDGVAQRYLADDSAEADPLRGGGDVGEADPGIDGGLVRVWLIDRNGDAFAHPDPVVALGLGSAGEVGDLGAGSERELYADLHVGA